jgi:hypothetical protein
MGLVRDAEVVLDSSDTHEFLDAGFDDIGGIVGIDVLGYAKNRKSVQEGDYRFDCSFVLGRVEHNEAGPFLLHQEDFCSAGEETRQGDGHVIAVPSAEERCVCENSFVHRIWHFLLKPEALTLGAGGDKSSDIDKSCWPMVARSLKLPDSFIAAVVATWAAVAGLNQMDVVRCDG